MEQAGTIHIICKNLVTQYSKVIVSAFNRKSPPYVEKCFQLVRDLRRNCRRAVRGSSVK